MALTKDDWIKAAEAALAEAGPSGVAVLPLAKRLGATRGSFYWHFDDRAQLLDEALRRWEQRTVDDIISSVESIPDPRQRLRALLQVAFTSKPEATIEVVLAGHNADPQVQPVLTRIAERRLTYLRDCFVASGVAADEATKRSAMVYAAYVGWMLLHAGTPTALLQPVLGTELADVLEHLLTL
jgi:AcrR family transcriptional regulator